MRFVFVLALALVLSSAVAGCGGKKGTETPSSSPTTPSTNMTTTPTTTPTTPPPTPPSTVLNATLKYNLPPTGNDAEMSFTVNASGTKLEITVVEKGRQANTQTTLAGEPQQSGQTPLPNVTFMPPTGPATKVEIDSVTAATYNDAGHVIKTVAVTLTSPVAGTWKVKIYGVGSNVDAAVMAVEKFT